MEWKDIKGYEGKYQVSDCGEVWSIPRNGTAGGRMKIHKDKDGYNVVKLRKDGKIKDCFVHRLVAIAFLKRADGLEEINHKDENKDNNCVDNLEWCDRAYNNSYGTRISRIREKAVERCGISVVCINTGEAYESIAECSRKTGISPAGIRDVLNGKSKSQFGFLFAKA